MSPQLKKFLFATLMMLVLIISVFSCSSNDQSVQTQGTDAEITDASSETIVQIDSPVYVEEPSQDDSGLDFDFLPAATGPIVYWGGPALTSNVTVYYIWYGNWETASSMTPQILEDLVSNFSGTPYSQILTSYYDQTTTNSGNVTTYVSDQVSFGGSKYVGYLAGNSLQVGGIEGIVESVINQSILPYDPNGIYYVLTSADVTETTSFGTFCNDFCGYHDVLLTSLNEYVHYAFVGDPGNCPQDCTIETPLFEAGIYNSPNGNWSADSMASVVVHELFEAMTDPLVSVNPAWQDELQQQEIGDMCAWRFDPVYEVSNGARANVQFGSRNFMIQQMWTNNDAGGACALHR